MPRVLMSRSLSYSDAIRRAAFCMAGEPSAYMTDYMSARNRFLLTRSFYSSFFFFSSYLRFFYCYRSIFLRDCSNLFENLSSSLRCPSTYFRCYFMRCSFYLRCSLSHFSFYFFWSAISFARFFAKSIMVFAYFLSSAASALAPTRY